MKSNKFNTITAEPNKNGDEIEEEIIEEDIRNDPLIFEEELCDDDFQISHVQSFKKALQKSQKNNFD